jgi:hypothetical protein
LISCTYQCVVDVGWLLSEGHSRVFGLAVFATLLPRWRF